MKGPKCRFENPSGSTYCGKCATRLDSSRDPGGPDVVDAQKRLAALK